MIQLPRQLGLLHLALGIELGVLGNSLCEAEILLAVIVAIDSVLTWTKQDLFPIFGVDMETVVSIPIVEHHIELGLQVVEAENVGKRSAVMPHVPILGKLPMLVALEHSCIRMQG